MKPTDSQQIVISPRSRRRGRPRREDVLEPSNATPVTITDGAGRPVAAYDPWTRLRYPIAELPGLQVAHAVRLAEWARKVEALGG